MRFEVYADRRGAFRSRLRGSNGRIQASSGESFRDRHNAERATRDLVDGILAMVAVRADEPVAQA